MKFDLVDHVLEVSPTRIVTLKHVSNAEEYLQDHFPSFPVLPGVMMLESLVQAARHLVQTQHATKDATKDATQDSKSYRLVLGHVRALKYGSFVRPGCSLRVEVELLGHADVAGEHQWDCRGQGLLIDPASSLSPSSLPGPVAVSGRFMLRPIRIAEVQLAKCEA